MINQELLCMVFPIKKISTTYFFYLLTSSLFISTNLYAQENDKIRQYEEQLKSADHEVRYDALTELIINYNEKHIDDTTVMYLETLNTLAEEANNDTYRAALHQLYGSFYARQKKFDSANYHFQRSVHYGIKTDDNVVLANVYTTKGRMFTDYRDEKDSAIHYYLKAETLYLESNDSSYLNGLYNNLGVLYEKNYGNYPKALEYFRSALKNTDKEDLHMQSILLGNIAYILRISERYDEAEKEYLRAIELQKQTQSWRKISDNYRGLARLYQIAEDTAKVLESSELSFSYRQKIGSPIQNFIARNSLSAAYIAYGYWDQPVKILRENFASFHSIPLSESQKIYYGRYINLLLALAYHETKKQNLVRYHLSEAEKYEIIADKLSSSKYKYLITLSAEVFEQIGLYEKSLSFYKQKFVLEDSLFSERNRRMITEIETKYKTEKKEQEIANLQQAAEIQSLALTQKNNQLIIGGLLAFVLAGAAFVYNRQRKIKQAKASLELEQRFLRSQLNPHFIFNSMGAIQQYLLTESSEKASDYMSVFSKLMRQILENSREEFITIKEEISMLRNYLDLQKLRFQDGFDYTIEVAEDLDVAYDGIPPMFAQPFIENALEHGLFKKNENTIAIKLFKVSDELIRLEIMDTGIGVTEQLTSADHKSLATRITNERLEKMRVSHRGEFSVTTENMENANGEIQGYKVSLSLPSKLVAA